MAKCAVRRTATTAPLVLHRTRIEKYAKKKFFINGQWRNKLFLIVINRFSLVKASVNASFVCKLRKNCLTVSEQCALVLKTPKFLHFPINKFQERNKFSSLLSKLVANFSILNQVGPLLPDRLQPEIRAFE
jgi:hypothetical protein